jgi:hypothetical protein
MMEEEWSIGKMESWNPESFRDGKMERCSP